MFGSIFRNQAHEVLNLVFRLFLTITTVNIGAWLFFVSTLPKVLQPLVFLLAFPRLPLDDKHGLAVAVPVITATIF